jgi:predicted metallopeptidase
MLSVVAARSTSARPPRLPVDSAPAASGFDFTLHVRHLAEDMTSRLEELAHIDLAQVGIRFCQARKAVRHGLWASLTPLRFHSGALTTKRRGRTWTIQRVHDAQGRELLYLLSFYLPRFMNLPPREKLATVVHELWHISPEFDGDLRRHPGRCYAHTHSQHAYDRQMHALAEKWLALEPPSHLHAFLDCNFAELQKRHGPVFGTKIPTPKLVRIPT